jgi:NADH-quinone oxidoreductase subunit H
MSFAWKFMLPMSLANMLAAGVWRFMPAGAARWIACALFLAALYVSLVRLLAGRKQLGKRVYRYAD